MHFFFKKKNRNSTPLVIGDDNEFEVGSCRFNQVSEFIMDTDI